MLSADEPIKKSENDKLNRRSFAESLAKTIVQNSFSSSFSIGLYGKWGSGKTSLVNMVLEAVKKDESNAIIVRFNPWLCSDPKQLISQFLKQLSATIKMKTSVLEDVCNLIDQYALAFDVGSNLADINPAVALLSSVGLKFLTKLAGNQLQKMTGDLQERKNQIANKLNKDGIKIIVSIDDIDRLSEDEIIAVFQLVRSVADFPNTVYLLTFDYDVVVHALSKVQYGDGKEYLEKIIQVPFEIPAANVQRIHGVLFDRLDSIMGNDLKHWDKVIWSEVFSYGIKHYIQTVRDVVRYANVYMLKYELLKDETDPVDLLALTALQVFEPSLYSKLPGYIDYLCGSGEYILYEQQEDLEERVKKALSPLFSEDAKLTDTEAAKNIIGILFPKARAAMGVFYGIGRTYSPREFMIHKNVASSECFDRYFRMSLEDGDIPAAVINNIMFGANEEEISDEMMRIYRDGKIIRLLDEIEAYSNRKSESAMSEAYSASGDEFSVSADRASKILTVLARNWGRFEVEDRGFTSIPFNWRLLFCVKSLLKCMDSASRIALMKCIFEDKHVQVSTLALMLLDFEQQIGRYAERDYNRDEADFSEEEVDALEEIFKIRAEEAISSGEALTQHRGLDFLWLLGKMDGEKAEEIKKSLVTDDVSLAKVVSYCTSLSTEESAKIVVQKRHVNLKALGEFIDVDEAKRRVREFLGTPRFFELPKDDQRNAIALVLMPEKRTEEGVIPAGVSEEAIDKELIEIAEDKGIEMVQMDH